MHKLIGVVIFLLIGVSAIAQVKVTIVNQTTGEKLEGVTVVVQANETVQNLVTDETGFVSIPNTQFPFFITASHVGYEQQKFEISSTEEYTLALMPSTSQLDQVVVTGQFEPQSVRNSVFKVKVISSEAIQAKGATRLQDVLNTEMNIRFDNDPALGVSNIRMQGMDGQNVKVLIDGVPVIGRQGTTNAFDVNQINVNTIERVEIIDGPMSTIYGADALAGVINIITKKPESSKLTTTARIHEESAGGEYSLFKQGIHQEGVGAAYRKGIFSTSADFAHNYTGGWQGTAPTRDKQFNPKRQFLTNGSFGFDQNTWNVYYRLDYLNEDIYNPGAYLPDVATDKHFITNRFIHQVQGGVKFTDNFGFTGAFAYSTYKRKTQTTNVNKATGEETLSLQPGDQDETKFDGITARGTFQYTFNDKFSIQPGYDLNLESGEGARLDSGTHRINDYAVFLSTEFKPFSFLNIRPGIRFVKNSVYDAPPALPSLNVKLSLSSRQDIRLSYGRGFRAPSLRELYFYFFDSNHSIKGNENLEAELSHSFNASWDWRIINNSRVQYTTTLSGFYNQINNMINAVQSSGNIFTYRNISKSKTAGIILNNKIQAGSLTASAGVGYTAQYNPYVDEDPSTPEVTWSPEVNGSLSYTFTKIGLTTTAFYKYTGKTPYYSLNSSNEVYQAKSLDYHWADLAIQKTFFKHFSAAIGSRNLFDITLVRDTAVGGGAHTEAGAKSIDSGRSFYATLTMNF